MSKAARRRREQAAKRHELQAAFASDGRFKKAHPPRNPGQAPWCGAVERLLER